jgi:hypothetical protein
MVSALPKPARYTPWTKGVYDVAPAMKPFGTDFGNGVADRRLFQLDTDRDRFRRNKREALCERHSKYVQRKDLSVDVEQAAVETIGGRLADEYPDRFLIQDSERGLFLCGEGGKTSLEVTDKIDPARPMIVPALERLALHIQEDFAIVSTNGDQDWVSYLHLCSPSHWAAEDKIGHTFTEVHRPVPGFERVNAATKGLTEAMVNKGPFVRFVWGVESDFRLNHHPQPAPGWTEEDWRGRDFSHGYFWVRVERQVVWGLPEVGAALFTIKVGFVRSDDVLDDSLLRDTLISSLESMSEDARHYKGLDRDWKTLMQILKG